MITAHRRHRRLAVIGAVLAAGALALTACSGSGGNNGGGNFTTLGLTSNATPNNTLKALSTAGCQAAQKDAPIKTDADDQTQHDQKLQLLAGQNALPSIFVSPGTPDLAKQFIKGGKLVDISAELKKDGLQDQILPIAASTMQKLYGQSDAYALPNELNIEGIWYNKKIFSDNGIAVPGTWDELTAASSKLLAKGIQPFAGDGKDGWPITRLVGAYIFRDLGSDALKKVADGKAKLTDAEYVKAAQEVADLGAKGYFGADVASLDYDGATNQFLTGKSAMMYMGSWLLGNISDSKQDVIGADNIGFMPFPAVSGGKGSIDEYPANVGLPATFGASTYSKDNNTGKWLKCIAANYGSAALKQGQITGFKVNDTVSGLNAPTQKVQDTLDTNKAASVLWFEALFNAKASSDSNTNAALLVTGQMTAEKFMQTIQSDLDNN